MRYNQNHKKLSPYAEFRTVMQELEAFGYYGAASPTQKAAFLRYAIRVLRTDICCEAMSSLLLVPYDEASDVSDDGTLFPIHEVYREIGTVPETKIISCRAQSIVAVPYDAGKLLDAVVDVDEDGFRFDGKYHRCNYYPEIDLAVVYDGRHHGAAVAMNEDIELAAQVFSLQPLFPVFATDGRDWLLNGDAIAPVLDHRFALMYEFAKTVHTLMQET